MPRTSNKAIHLLKGFKDILPEQKKEWNFFFKQSLPLVKAHGFERIDTPYLESLNLYNKLYGKQLKTEEIIYSFQDKNDEKMAIRPEFTASLARAYFEHGMNNRPQPVKLYTHGSLLRYNNEKYRQFTQLDLEAFGSNSPIIDAQLILLGQEIFNALQLPVIVQINSLGDKQTRNNFINKFKQYLTAKNRKKALCEECKKNYSKNPWLILNCPQENCHEITEDAPQIVDFLDEESKEHFMQVLEYLDDLNIKYNLNTRLVEERDYFNRTIFEFYLDYSQMKTDGEKKKAGLGLPLATGGRYDGLLEVLGGKATPMAGMSVYLERTISKIRELKIDMPDFNEIEVFIAQIGADARKEAFKLHERLMRAGIKVRADFPQNGLKAQLEKAAQYKAKISLILGQKELLDQTIIIRDMQSGIQEIVNYERVLQEVKKRIDPQLTSVRQYKIKKINKNKTNDEQQKKFFDSRSGQKYNSSLEGGNEILSEDVMNYDYTEQKEDKGYDNQILF